MYLFLNDRTKKTSPQMQHKSPLTINRRPQRSLESSTAASRSRAAATNAYHGSPSLRRNLLDAAKTPDILNKSTNVVTTFRTKQIMQSNAILNVTREKKEPQNLQGSESPSKRSSLKSSVTNKTTTVKKRIISSKLDDKIKKCHNEQAQKQFTVGSRSGTFLKDEPTILKKIDIKSPQMDT